MARWGIKQTDPTLSGNLQIISVISSGGNVLWMFILHVFLRVFRSAISLEVNNLQFCHVSNFNDP
jgi:hypothetical protein